MSFLEEHPDACFVDEHGRVAYLDGVSDAHHSIVMLSPDSIVLQVLVGGFVEGEFTLFKSTHHLFEAITANY